MLAACGCTSWKVAQNPHRVESGCIFFLPGIEGESATHQGVLHGLLESEVRSTLVLHDWTTGRPWEAIRHLRDEDFHRQAAHELVERIVGYQDAFPGRPVQLLGHSGGAGIIVKALERLPPGRSVTRTVLMSPALSSEYDLTRALSRSRHGTWHFHSDYDWAFVGAGTTLLGTMDGVNGSAAGKIGFRLPADAPPERAQMFRNALHQVPFRWEMASCAHLGGHGGYLWSPFIRNYVAPILREGEIKDRRAPRLPFSATAPLAETGRTPVDPSAEPLPWVDADSTPQVLPVDEPWANSNISR